MTQPPDTRCQAIAADGSPCANPPLAGSAFCALHSDQSDAGFDLSSDGWLAIDDRATTQPSPRVLPVTSLRPADSAAPAPLGDDLWIDDRLTEQRTRAAERQSRLQGELARFAHAAQRLAPPGAAAMAPSAQEAQRLLSQLLGPLYPRQLIDQGGAWLSPDLWKGAWYVAAYLLRAQTSGLRRRLEGDYEIDDFGRDEEFLASCSPWPSSSTKAIGASRSAAASMCRPKAGPCWSAIIPACCPSTASCSRWRCTTRRLANACRARWQIPGSPPCLSSPPCCKKPARFRPTR